MRSRSPRRFATACFGALMVVSGLAPARALASAESDLADAQRRANEAAAELSAAETALARAEDAVAHGHERVSQAEDRVARSRDHLRDLAIDRYVGGTTRPSQLFGIVSATELVRAQGYTQALAGSTTDSLRQYRAETEELREEVAALEAKQEAQAAALDALRARRQAAVAEVERLARVVEEARAAREAEAARRQAAAAPRAPAAPTAAAPTPAGPALAPATAAAPAGGDWVCPVHEPRAFSNDFGAPRAGGRSHQGNDILAPRGTPVVANVDGVVRRHPNNLGGLAYFLRGDDGSSYYGAHLDSYGAQGRVTAGTIIGTVGDSGDAKGGPPHLHFEIERPNGVTVNPYSTLVQYC